VKILEISGSNLASLRDAFTIPLEQQPFNRDGLFAIRGVTGSGKSTIIDAMCLALYDDTPRFTGQGGAKVGSADQDPKDRLTGTDARGILHRGAGQGWAQVVFRGVDGHRWRARWSVSRSRGRADGRYQSQEMEVEDLDTGYRNAGRKTEVLALIREKVGLSFDQFKRSVLLAQGEFAAFTKADPDARGLLLEAMTGTEIYTRLSVEAQKRSQAELQAQERLAAEREALGLLSDPQRTAMEEQAEAEQNGIAELGLELAALQRGCEWYAHRETFEAQLAQAAGRVEAAGLAVEDALPRRRALEQVEAVQPLRLLQAALAQAEDLKASLEGQAEQAQNGLPGAERAAQEGAAALSSQQELLDQARAAIAAARPELDAARVLDTRIQDGRRRQEEAAGTAAKLEKEALAAEMTCAASGGEAVELAATLRELAGQLEADRSIQSLAQSWSWVEKDLEGFKGARTELAQVTQEQAGLQAQVKTRQALIEKLQGQAAGLEAALSGHQDALAALEQRQAEDPRTTLEADRKQTQARLDLFRRAETILKALHPLLELAEQAAAEAGAQSRTGAQASQAVQAAETEIASLAGRLKEARAALEQVQAAQSLEDRRHQLVPLEPCPLCGALEHPWAAGSPLSGLLDGSRARVQELERQKAGQETARTAALAEAAGAAKAGAKALRDEQGHRAGAIREQNAWAEARQVLAELPEDGGSKAAMTFVQDRIPGLERTLAEVERRAAVLRDLEIQAAQLRTTRDQISKDLKNLTVRVQEADQARQASDLEAVKRGEALANLQARLLSLAAALAPHLDPADQARLQQDPGALLARLTEAVASRRRTEDAQAAASSKAGELAVRLEGQRATAKEKRMAAQGAADSAGTAGQALAEVLQSRQALLQGQPVATVEAALEAARLQAEADLERARGEAQRARAALGELRNTLGILLGQLDQAVQASIAPRQAYFVGLAQWGGDPGQLPALLAWVPEQVQSERKDLQAIVDEQNAARAVLAAHQGALDKHLAAGGPDRSQADLAAALQAGKPLLDARKETLWNLRNALQADDQTRARAAALAEHIREQELRTRLWQEMNTLIGSSSGKTFRSYAQSLTLDALLVYANEQLARLACRYQLQRIPGFDLDIQVIDRDMGDEIRALNGLSGGETFLVSLALALGLSSLSARETPVDSLFIDEGFGSLDSGTLEVALSVLDELQSQGRQVGIISHVDGLASHIPVQVSVEKLGGGRSRVVLPEAGKG